MLGVRSFELHEIIAWPAIQRDVPEPNIANIPRHLFAHVLIHHRAQTDELSLALAMNADVLIAVDGQFGTLTEIAYGNIYGKKVIGIGTWDIQGVKNAETAEEAIDLALKDYFPLTS